MQLPANKTTLKTVAEYLQIALFVCALLFFGRRLFIPLFFGLLIAVVLYPVCRQMERRLSKTLSITIALSAVVLLFSALIFILGWQLSLFQKDIAAIWHKSEPLLNSLQHWIFTKFSISTDMQQQWLYNFLNNNSGNIGGAIFNVLNITVYTFFDMFITIIYAALFLYHRGSFVKFIQKIAGNSRKRQLDSIFRETIHTYFNYIKGVIMVYIVVGILNSIGLYALGIPHALLFGMITAIMTIIPYVGIIISALLPISMAFITKDSLFYPIAVIGVFSFVQYLEANVIFPKIVGAQLNVSTWATLVAIITGGIVWGVAGMILFIPFAAIAKIITDNIDELKPLNILLSRN